MPVNGSKMSLMARSHGSESTGVGVPGSRVQGGGVYPGVAGWTPIINQSGTSMAEPNLGLRIGSRLRYN